jgi:hypothetical protein
VTAAQLDVESAIRFHLAPVAVVVHFRLEGEAADLAVAPPAGTLMTFHRGDVAVTLERERDGWGFDCLIAAHYWTGSRVTRGPSSTCSTRRGTRTSYETAR